MLFYSGFSQIHLVENNSTKRKYALKKLTCHSREDETIAMREIEITRKIKHENVIHIVDYMIKGFCLFICVSIKIVVISFGLFNFI